MRYQTAPYPDSGPRKAALTRERQSQSHSLMGARVQHGWAPWAEVMGRNLRLGRPDHLLRNLVAHEGAR